MPEKYQPTGEEIKKAEGTMTPRQFELSRDRGLGSDKLREDFGIDGYLYAELSDVAEFKEINGVMNGHEIKISIDGTYRKGEPIGMGTNGTIDGLVMGKDDVQRFMDKYYPYIVRHTVGTVELAGDISRSTLEGKLKDIGL